jgi:hypothetical protein
MPLEGKMISESRWTKELAQTGLIAGLLFCVSASSWGQETAPTLPPASPDAQILADPAPVPGSEACPAEPEQKPFWATHPPVTSFPRPAFWLIPPSGPGYYSAWDCLTGNYLQNTPKYPYSPISITAFSFFDADFRYLDDPNNTQHDWLFDLTKRIHLGDNWLFSVGGEERVRYMNEVDSRLNKAGADNVYELLRTRVYADLWYRDIFRVYAELLDASTVNQDLSPAPIDKVKPTFLNLFTDIKIFELDDSPAYVRVGRQEMLYGSERLISPLDWANTRRTFQGVKSFWHTDKLDIDAFWVQLVFDNLADYHYGVDTNINFDGVWITYRPQKGQTVDLYYLNLADSDHVATGEFNDVGGYDVNTLGSRYAGDYHNFLWDGEGMFQFGSWANQVTAAGAATIGGGYHFADCPMNPTFWVYYDWASGDPHPGVGDVHRTFNQLFPFGHYYFGGIDLIGRQNIRDLNMETWIWPTKWISLGVQYHILNLDEAKDALYNSGGTPILGQALAGPAKAVPGEASNVGDELVFITNFHLSNHQDIFLQYCKLYAGDFLKENGRGSPSLFAFQWSYKW